MLQILDGPTTSSPEIARMCRQHADVTSSSRYMTIIMTTDGSVASRGFNATYTTCAFSCNEINCSSPALMYIITFYAACSGSFSSDTDGVITSPSYPSNYPPFSDCQYNIHSSHPGDRLTLTFTHMDVPSTWNCSRDYVQILSGNDGDGPQIERVCGTRLPTPVITRVRDTVWRTLYQARSSSKHN